MIDDLLTKLEEQVDNNKMMIGTIFSEIVRYFSNILFNFQAEHMTQYTEYVNNYERAREFYLKSIKENVKFAQFMRECEKNKKLNNHSLEDLLITG